MTLQENINKDISRQLISSRTLLSPFFMIDEVSRRSPAYQDPRFMPFYYHLGKYIEPRTLLEIGFNIGLASGCVMKSCRTVENFFAFQLPTTEHFSFRIGAKNIKRLYKGLFDCYQGDLLDPKFVSRLSKNKWDLTLINEEMSYDNLRTCLDMVWAQVSDKGVIILDHARQESTKTALADFSKTVNREYVYFDTRYGTGMVQR